jgi:nucleoside-diphosphate-sugar epimerase
MLEGMKIAVTGCAGQVGFPICQTLAANNQVYGVGRFSRPGDRERLEAVGVTCVRADLSEDDLTSIPDDVDYVLNFAVARSAKPDFDADLSANAEGVGRLMDRCRGAKAFLHCSSTAVYEPAGHRPLSESDPLGDNHRIFLPTYSIAKIAAEAVARFCARAFQLPTTIARLGVPYGDNGGWPAFHLAMMIAGKPIPVSSEAPNRFSPIHEDDFTAQIPGLLDAASIPATIVNWAGSEVVSIEEWCAYFGELTGLEPKLVASDRTLRSVVADTTRLRQLVGECKVHWRDGLRRMVRARHPELELRDGV